MMLAAFITSGLFLISYLAYHFSSHLITRYEGEGLLRTVYFTILISHSVLAVAVPPMAFVTLFRGLKMNVEKHRRIARWTLPIWLYVSVTGVVIYVMLYQLPA
jgi:putative membrane protein